MTNEPMRHAETLSRAQKQELQRLHSRHGRRKAGAFLVEGLRCCREAVRHRPDWLRYAVCSDELDAPDLLAELQAAGVVVTRAPAAEVAKLSATESSPGILLVARRPSLQQAPTQRDPFLLVLDRIADPGNLGTILRTAWAVGLRQVALTAGAADPLAPKVVRAGMGAQFAVTLCAGGDLSAMLAAAAEAGYRRCYVTAGDGDCGVFSEAFELSGSVLVLGNEAHGSAVPEQAASVSIPMPGGAESLNVAQAATVFLCEALRRGILPP